MNKNYNEWWIINTLLLIIIIIILLSRCNKNNDYKQGTDVYNISLNDKDNCNSDNKKIEDSEEIIIEDKNGNYLYQRELDIFNNSMLNNKIAPGISNTYDFKVLNQSNSDVKYLIKMNNVSNYNINIKYRLKRNKKYIIGNKNEWVTENELTTAYNKLKKGKSDKYSLDWKWFELDNYVGENIISKYIFKINFRFEKINN